jgi:hypothetical protein
MSLDVRSQMGINLIMSFDLPAAEKFRELARLCAAWKLTRAESMPLAEELKRRLGLSDFGAVQTLRASLDGQEMELRKRN